MKRRDTASAQPLAGGRRPESNFKRYGYPALLILSTVLIFALSQIVALFLVAMGMSIVSSGTNVSLSDSVGGQFCFILIAEAFAIWLVYFFLHERGLKFSSIGLARRPNWGDVGRAGLGFLVFFAILIGLGLILNQLSPELVDKKQNIGFDHLDTGAKQLLAFLALVIFPPIGEEILVRGYLYSGLRRVWNFVPSLIVTSLIFGVAHLEFGSSAGLVWAAAIDTLFLSVVLVYLREKTGALYAGMMVHMLNNLLAFIVIIN